MTINNWNELPENIKEKSGKKIVNGVVVGVYIEHKEHIFPFELQTEEPKEEQKDD